MKLISYLKVVAGLSLVGAACAAVEDASRELTVTAPRCNGNLVRRVINFESKRSGERFAKGDKPSRLPDGVDVRGTRRANVTPRQSSKNDLVILNAGNPVGHPNVASYDENLVLAILDNPSSRNPVPSKKGGWITFRFQKQGVTVNQVRFLGVGRNKHSFVTAKNTKGKDIGKVYIPANFPQNKPAIVTPTNFFNVRTLEVVLQSPAAVATVDYSICIPKPKQCPAGTGATDLRDADGCRPCRAGFFSTGASRLCRRCPLGSISGQRSSSCTKCPAGRISNAARRNCQRCPVGTFNPVAGGQTCRQCGARSVARLGASRCERCVGLQVPNGNRSVCVRCAAGREPVDNRTCRPCLPGTFSNNGLACQVCNDNSVASNSGTRVCALCAPGTRPNANKTGCFRIEPEPPVTAPPVPTPTVPPAPSSGTPSSPNPPNPDPSASSPSSTAVLPDCSTSSSSDSSSPSKAGKSKSGKGKSGKRGGSRSSSSSNSSTESDEACRERDNNSSSSSSKAKAMMRSTSGKGGRRR